MGEGAGARGLQSGAVAMCSSARVGVGEADDDPRGLAAEEAAQGGHAEPRRAAAGQAVRARVRVEPGGLR